MPFCINCGEEVTVKAKFCPNCGKKLVEDISEPKEQRQQTYAGEIRKCPICGEPLSAFEIKCHACGSELRNTKSSEAVLAFWEQIKEIETTRTARLPGETEELIANLIRNYPVPNTKEDVIEFMILASSNIDTGIYAASTEQRNSKEYQAKKELADAWSAKANQVYHKAELSFRNDPIFSKIQEIHTGTTQKINLAKRTGFLHDGLRKLPLVAKYCGIAFVIIICFMLLKPAYQAYTEYSVKAKAEKEMQLQEKEEQLAALVAEIQELLTKGDYDSALAKAQDITMDRTAPQTNQAHWDKIRIDLIETIKNEKREATVKKSKPPASSTKLKGQDCDEIIEQFLALGFINIDTEKIEDLVTGLLTKDGQIEEVSIDGKTIFSQNDFFFIDVPVIIRYHTFS